MTIDPSELPLSARTLAIRKIVRTVGAEGAAADLPEPAVLASTFATIRAHYPDMTPEQIDAAIRAEFRTWDAQSDEPGFWDDVDAARALDPDWHDNPDRSFGPSPGALHDTPQKLVAAYRAWQDATLPADELIDVIMWRATPARAKPGDAERYAGTMMQMVKAHPRSDELLKYGVEQARRAGLLGKRG